MIIVDRLILTLKLKKDLEKQKKNFIENQKTFPEEKVENLKNQLQTHKSKEEKNAKVRQTYWSSDADKLVEKSIRSNFEHIEGELDSIKDIDKKDKAYAEKFNKLLSYVNDQYKLVKKQYKALNKIDQFKYITEKQHKGKSISPEDQDLLLDDYVNDLSSAVDVKKKHTEAKVAFKATNKLEFRKDYKEKKESFNNTKQLKTFKSGIYSKINRHVYNKFVDMLGTVLKYALGAEYAKPLNYLEQNSFDANKYIWSEDNKYSQLLNDPNSDLYKLNKDMNELEKHIIKKEAHYLTNIYNANSTTKKSVLMKVLVSDIKNKELVGDFINCKNYEYFWNDLEKNLEKSLEKDLEKNFKTKSEANSKKPPQSPIAKNKKSRNKNDVPTH